METLEKIASSASRRYKVYTIPKKTGGNRIICHPSRPLKAIQRWLTRSLLSLSDVHPSATAYEKGSSIRDNALRHAGTQFTLRMDFTDFFPSFDDVSVKAFLEELNKKRSVGLSQNDINFAVKIFCRQGRLTIGAPSSPKLTNAMMFNFDRVINDYATENNIIYTRYADDLFLSSFEKGVLENACSFVSGVVSRQNSPKLSINEKKTLHLSRAKHRSVTGLVLTTEGGISLGRKRKREIKTLAYKAITGSLPAAERGYLAGLIAFAVDVEPDFVSSLSMKFGTDVSEWVKKI